jgi:hypothetical protein
MFGHSDNNQPVNGQSNQDNGTGNDPAMANDQIMHDGSLEESATTVSGGNDYGLNDIPAAPQPSEPPTNPFTQPATTSDFASPSSPAEDTSATSSAPVVSGDKGDGGDLLDLKQKALQELSPLVNHLEQNPEEKFKTTMMMIQASDDQSLLSAAYEAAQAIPDEKAKAQALLDVVNEINYFTQAH